MARNFNKMKKPKRSLAKRLFFGLFIFGLIMGVLGIAAAVGGWYWIGQQLPQLERLADYRPPAVTQILDKDGRLLSEFSHQRRYVVPLNQIPSDVIGAFVAAEDGDFFKHVGVDVLGIIRAAVANFRAGRVVQGGSTITQQVARALLLSPRRTMLRKAKEIVLAYRMEKYLTKEEILYLYLNQIYLGHGAYGIQAAAQTYFGKDCSKLVLAEGALIAGLIKAPTRYSPVRYPRRARARQEYVIGRMLADGQISPEEATAALNTQIKVQINPKATSHTDYYTEYVRQWLENRFGQVDLYDGGLTVYTACDPAMTAAGQQAIKHGLADLTRRQGFKGPIAQVSKNELNAIKSRPVDRNGAQKDQIIKAVVTRVSNGYQNVTVRMGAARGKVIDDEEKFLKRYKKGLRPGDVIQVIPQSYDLKGKSWMVKVHQEPLAQSALLAIESGTGRVRVMIGGRDFDLSQFNRATQASRQPGSAFKPFIFSAALNHPSQKYTPTSVIMDAPVVYDDPGRPGVKWKPKNYEGRFYGPTTLRTALEHSRNVVTVKILSDMGLKYTIEYAKRFGFQSEIAPNLSLALGTCGMNLLELTKAYSVFANQGRLVDPVVVEKVVDRHGEVVYSAQQLVQQVISPQNAFLTTQLLRGVVQHGTGRQMLELGRPLAGKTGTTNDLRDALFMGFSPQLVCGVWVGQDDNKPLGRRETGGRAAGPIWKEFMGQALKDMPRADFPEPEGVVFVRVDKKTGQAVSAGQEGGFFEAFLAGTEPAVPAPGQVHTAQAEAVDGGETGGAVEDFMQSETFAPPTEAVPDPEKGGAPADSSSLR